MKNRLGFLMGLMSATLLLACGSTDSCQEVVKKDCVCTFEYNPVCGCNDKTYGNACAAECSGITSYTPGECQ